MPQSPQTRLSDSGRAELGVTFLTDLERSVWNAVTAKDGDTLSQLFSDDYIEITLQGKRVLKDTVVAESPVRDEITSYRMDQEEVVMLAEGTALLSYHVTIEGNCNGDPIRPKDRWATSVWRRENSDWKCCFFQQSPYPTS